jgi:cytochrome c oxidase subunit IV
VWFVDYGADAGDSLGCAVYLFVRDRVLRVDRTDRCVPHDDHRKSLPLPLICSPTHLVSQVDILEVAGVLVSFFLVNRFGRRPLLLNTMVVMAATLIVCGALGIVQNRSKAMNTVIASMIMIYVFVFNLAWGPVSLQFEWLGCRGADLCVCV